MGDIYQISIRGSIFVLRLLYRLSTYKLPCWWVHNVTDIVQVIQSPTTEKARIRVKGHTVFPTIGKTWCFRYPHASLSYSGNENCLNQRSNFNIDRINNITVL